MINDSDPDNALHTPDAPSGADDDLKRMLRKRFPGWNIVRSDKGRWWAFRVPPPDAMNRASDVDADTPTGLYLKLCDIDCGKPPRRL